MDHWGGVKWKIGSLTAHFEGAKENPALNVYLLPRTSIVHMIKFNAVQKEKKCHILTCSGDNELVARKSAASLNFA